MRRWRQTTTAALTVVTMLVAGCAAEIGDAATGIRIMVPNRPGSGYDVTARNGGQGVRGLGDPARSRGLQPARHGHTVGLQRLVYEKGNSC